MKDLNQLIKLTKLKLFTSDLIFFGMNLNKFNWVIADFDKHIEGFVVFNEDNRNEVQYGNIYLNKYYLEKPDYNHLNLTFVLCHELLHVLNKHGLRGKDKIHELWCIACDHVVDSILRKVSGITPYNNTYNIIHDLRYERPDCTTEQAYEWLLRRQHRISYETQTFTDSMGLGTAIIVTDKYDGRTFTINDRTLQLNQEESKFNINQFVSEARATLENLKQRGYGAGALISALNEILKVEIPWEVILEKAIKTNTVMKPDERSWRNLNKNYIVHNLTIPGYSLTEQPEATGILIICVDSSGSISDQELKKFAYVIRSSIKYFQAIHVLVHDIIVHQHKIFNKNNINEFEAFLRNEGFKGRSGTAHENVFKKIQKEFWEKDKDQISLVISLTDGFSDIEDVYTRFDWIKSNIPLIFLVPKVGGRNLHLNYDNFKNIIQINFD